MGSPCSGIWLPRSQPTLRDNGLYAEFLDRVEHRNLQLDLSEEGFSMGRLMAQAVVALNRSDLIEQVPPHFAGWVAVKLGGPALEHLAIQTRAVVERLLQPISAVPPEGVEMTYGALKDGLDATFSFDEMEDGQGDLQAQLEQRSDAERGSAQFAERQRGAGRQSEGIQESAFTRGRVPARLVAAARRPAAVSAKSRPI